MWGVAPGPPGPQGSNVRFQQLVTCWWKELNLGVEGSCQGSSLVLTAWRVGSQWENGDVKWWVRPRNNAIIYIPQFFMPVLNLQNYFHLCWFPLSWRWKSSWNNDGRQWCTCPSQCVHVHSEQLRYHPGQSEDLGPNRSRNVLLARWNPTALETIPYKASLSNRNMQSHIHNFTFLISHIKKVQKKQVEIVSVIYFCLPRYIQNIISMNNQYKKHINEIFSFLF